MEFPKQEFGSGLPCPSPGDLPNPGTEPASPALQADSLPSEPPGKTKLVIPDLHELLEPSVAGVLPGGEEAETQIYRDGSRDSGTGAAGQGMPGIAGKPSVARK